MKSFYGVMYTVNASFLVSGALYCDGKITLRGLTELEIAKYTGTINRIDAKDITDDELSTLITRYAEQPANEVLGILSMKQGKLLHPSFMDKTTTEITN